MNPIPELGPMLKQLRLSGILDSLEARNREAIDLKLAYTDFIALLIQDEVARREQKKFTSRLRRASFRTQKTLDQFDFDRLPKLNRALVHDLATNRYLAEHAPSSSSVRSASAKAISRRLWVIAPSAAASMSYSPVARRSSPASMPPAPRCSSSTILDSKPCVRPPTKIFTT